VPLGPVRVIHDRLEITPEDRELLGHPNVGAVLLRPSQVSLAPRPAIGPRKRMGPRREQAFHSEPETAGRLAVAFMRGMQRAGMASIAPEFPCAAATRPWPRQKRARDAIDVLHAEAIPFARLAHKGLAGMTMAPTVYPGVAGQPVAYSRRWLQGLLRTEIAFDGAVFSHDLAVDEHTRPTVVDAALQALNCGCDLITAGHARAAASRVAGGLAVRDRPISRARLLPLHGRPARGVMRPDD
jgi:beta-glucosidase-like glycosyl hydrolase